MRRQLQSRLRALEAKVADPGKLPKAVLPEWLVEDLVKEGVRFDESGRPERDSLPRRTEAYLLVDENRFAS